MEKNMKENGDARQRVSETKHGGKRKGAGRPCGVPKYAVTVRLCESAVKKLDLQPNKSAYIERLILNDR